MRRKDRELNRDSALAVVDKCFYSVLATISTDGSPYCIPLSMAREGECVYFHSAKEGHKVDNLRHNNRVCISCVGYAQVVPGSFALFYESAIINGVALEITDHEEMIHALEIISRRYTPDIMDAFDNEIKKNIDRTSVWKISIDEICGKGRMT